MTPENVLVVVAHPDDEVLGCGGTMARHVNAGDAVKVVILADGVSSRSSRKDVDQVEVLARRENAIQANKILGVNDISFYEYVDNRMDGVNLLDVIKDIEGEIENFQPSVVYTHHAGDVNIDHGVVHEAVITACRPKPDFCVKELLFLRCLPVLSGDQLHPECSSHPLILLI